MTKAAELAKMGEVLTNSQIGGRRNLIINGAMQVAQRGTSFTQADSYSLDRYKINASSETLTVSQQSFVAGQTDVPNAENYLRMIVTTTGNNAGIAQRIEGVEQLSGQTITLSFYARGGEGGQGVPTTFRTYFNQNFGSGGSSAVNVQGSTNHTLTSSWQKFTATVTLGSTSGKTIGTSSYTELFFQQTTGEACDFDITLVQLEVGEQATPFEHRSYGEELALCQRYLYRHVNGNNACVGTIAYGRSTAQVRTAITFPVTMRATPSLDASSGTNYYKFENDISTIYATALGGVTNATTTGTEIYVNMSGITRGDARILLSANSSAYVDFDSEL